MKKKNFGIVVGGVLLALTISLWANSISVLTGNKSGLFNFLTTGTLEAREIAVSIPSGFPTTGQNFYRSAGGVYTTDFVPATYVATWNITKTIYVDFKNGNDSSGNGSVGLPYKSVLQAVTIGNASGDTAIRIIMKMNGANVVSSREGFGTLIISGKRYYIVPDNTNYYVYASEVNSDCLGV